MWSYRSLFDDRVPQNEDHLRLLRNYASAVLTLAAQYVADGNYKRAEKLFELGEMFSEKSIEGLEREAERDPQIFAIRLSKGYIKLKMGKFNEAEDILNRARPFLPQSEYNWRLALVKLYSGEVDSARELANTLIASVPEFDPIWGLSLDTLYTLIPPDSLTNVSYRLFTKGQFDLALKMLERSNTTQTVKVWAGTLINAIKERDEVMFGSLASYAPFDTTKAGEWKNELNKLYTSLARYLRQVGDEEGSKRMEDYAKIYGNTR